MGTPTSKPRPAPSINDTITTYLHLVALNSPYAMLYHHKILERLQKEPVSELDVQALWALGSPEWIDAILANIVKFDVLSTQPGGGYVQLFIETEMLGYEQGAAKWLVDVYERHKRVVGEQTGRRKRGLRKAVGRFAADRIEKLRGWAW